MRGSVRFSIVVPVYNNPSDLANCLDSIQKLNFDKSAYEVIVVDNNSTDDTAEVAHAHGVTVLVEKDFQSSYAARNRGIRAARGEFIAFTDSDCVVAPDWLAQIDAEVEDEVGCLAGEILSTPAETLIERFSDEIGLLRQRGPLSGWHFKPYAQTANAIYRKAVFDTVGLFDPSMQSGGDAVIAWRMQDKTSYRLKFVPQAVVYHHHRTSVPELWKQFRRYGAEKMSWARAQRNYMPPALAKLEMEVVTALDRAITTLAKAEIDEKEFVFPVVQAATGMAHLSGYLHDMLATAVHDVPLETMQQHVRGLLPKCDICGSTAFVPSQGKTTAGKPTPQCAECGSFERHRALANLFENAASKDLGRCSIVSFEDPLPKQVAGQFRSACDSPLDVFAPARDRDIAVAPSLAAIAHGCDLAETLARMVSHLKADGALILVEQENTKFEMIVDGKNTEFMIDDFFCAAIAELMPNTFIRKRKIFDHPTKNNISLAIISSYSDNDQTVLI